MGEKKKEIPDASRYDTFRTREGAAHGTLGKVKAEKKGWETWRNIGVTCLVRGRAT